MPDWSDRVAWNKGTLLRDKVIANCRNALGEEGAFNEFRRI